MIWFATHTTHLGALEKFGLAFGIGVISGTIGIVYSHELMHQKPAFERWLGDLLMAMALYGHFRSEHLRVHHLYVGTPEMRSRRAITRAFTAISPACCVSARARRGGPRR